MASSMVAHSWGVWHAAERWLDVCAERCLSGVACLLLPCPLLQLLAAECMMRLKVAKLLHVRQQLGSDATDQHCCVCSRCTIVKGHARIDQKCLLVTETAAA